ncbi:MAG: ammonium transporter [Leptolyngbya sp. SIO1D8]|nr:ammonium transporter [Leptolyngbya sp. SIO1D8]
MLGIKVRSWYHLLCFLISFAIAFLCSATKAQASSSTSLSAIDTLWVILCACLVFFMGGGFAMLEAGLCRQKNAVVVLAKNLIVFSLAATVFWILGYGLMFVGEGHYLGWGGFFLRGSNMPLEVNNVPINAHFFFQLMFAGTAATIVSGAVAERVRFSTFVIFSLLFTFIYSFLGHWVWSEYGWLYDQGFRDFAGSTVVHFVGGCGGLVGTWLLGPRIGRYEILNQGYTTSKPIPSKELNFGFAVIGCFILWLGWFGFNAGSTLSADPNAISHIVVATMIAGSTGSIAATFFSFLLNQKPSIASIINGILAGCVSITASCAFVDIPSAALIGFIGGIIVLIADIFLDRAKIDDPVSAIPVHLVCGFWGTLSVGFFSNKTVYTNWHSIDIFVPETPGILFGGGPDLLITQAIGIAAIGVFALFFSWLFWYGSGLLVHLLVCYQSGQKFSADNWRLKGLRVDESVEQQGLNYLFVEHPEELVPENEH